MPVGSVLAYAAPTAPDGWLLCDGSHYSKDTYPRLFAIIGTQFGGNGTPQFYVPDLRGRVARGVDGSAGNDPDSGTRTSQASGGNTGNNVGSVQADALQGHVHDIDSSALDSTNEGDRISTE